MVVFPYEIALALAPISKRLNLRSSSFFALAIYKRGTSFPNSKSKGNFVGKELPSLVNSKSKQRTTPKAQPLGNSKSKIVFTLAIYKRLNLFSSSILALAIYKRKYLFLSLPKHFTSGFAIYLHGGTLPVKLQDMLLKEYFSHLM